MPSVRKPVECGAADIALYVRRLAPLTLHSAARVAVSIYISMHISRFYLVEVFERSRFKSSPLEKTRSTRANPVELSWGSAGVSTGVASFDGDFLIGMF